jgi:hypothetical protein
MACIGSLAGYGRKTFDIQFGPMSFGSGDGGSSSTVGASGISGLILTSPRMSLGGNRMDDPGTRPLVIHDDAYQLLARHFREGSVGLEKWLQREVPALGGLTPMEYVRSGHTWAEVLNIMDAVFSGEIGA